MKYKLLLLYAVLSITLTIIADGQNETFDEPWRLVRFTTEDGLPSNHVFSVVETSKGIIWALTGSGVSWYDGFSWHSVDSSLGLPKATLPKGLACDSQNRIIVLTNDKLYRGNEYGFKLIARGNITDAFPFPNGDILFNANSSLFLSHNDSIQLFSPSLNITKGKTTRMYITAKKNIWVSTTSGLYRWKSSDWVAKILVNTYPIVFTALDENDDGNGMTAISSPGYYIGLWEWKHYEKPYPVSDEHTYGAKKITLQNNGEVAVLFQSGEIKIRQNGIWNNFTLLKNQLTNVEDIIFQSNGNFWVATANGLYLYKRSMARWEYLSHELPQPSNSITEILPTTNAELWIGSAEGIEIRNKNNLIRKFQKIQNTKLYVVSGLEEDQNGNIWISSGSSFDGTFKWDGHQWSHINVGDDTSGIMVHKIRKDRKGRLWFLGLSRKNGTSNADEPGAFVYENGKFTRWGKPEGLIDGRVYAFAEGNDGAYWFGTYGGISRWKPSSSQINNQQGTWKHWTESQGLLYNRVFTLAIDQNNRLWFGDRLRGLGYIDEQDSVHYLTTNDGLISNDVWDLSVGTDNKLWISTDLGVCSYKNEVFSNFDIKNGLTPITCWPILASNDKIYIGTQGNGVAVLKTEENSPVPRIFIDDALTQETAALVRWKVFSYWQEEAPQDIQARYRVAGQQWSNWNTNRELTIPELSPGNYTFELQAKNLFGNYNVIPGKISFTITLPWQKHPFFFVFSAVACFSMIGFSAKYYSNKRMHAKLLRISEAKFRRLTEATFEGIIIHNMNVMLEANTSVLKIFGYSDTQFIGHPFDDFIAPESKKIIMQSRQESSDIPFEATGIKKDGSRIAIEIIGKSMPYEGHILNVMAIRDITERKRIEQQIVVYQQELQSLASELSFTEERERKQMAIYLHDAIGQSLALCKMKLQSLYYSSDNKKVGEINDMFNQMIKNTQTLTFELSPPILYELDFEDAVEWLTKKMIEQYKVALEFAKDPHPKPLRQELRILLFNAVRELIVNSIKHANASMTTIRIQKVGKFISICVEDNGKGFSPISPAERSTRGGGFGLFNIRERLKHFGGTLDITSELSVGTTAILKAPLSNCDTQTQKSS